MKRDYAARHCDCLSVAHTQIRRVAPKKDDLTRLGKDEVVPCCCAGRWGDEHVHSTALVSLLQRFLDPGSDIAPGWIAEGTFTPAYLQSVPCRPRMWTWVEPVGVATLDILWREVDLLRGCCLLCDIPLPFIVAHDIKQCRVPCSSAMAQVV